MTILTDTEISKPDTVKIVRLCCDRCGVIEDFSIDEPSDLVLEMNQRRWAVPVEGKPDWCPDCAIRMPLR